VDVSGDPGEIAVGRLGDQGVRGLAVVVGHVQILLLEPLADDVDGDLLDLDGVGGEGVAEQVRLEGDGRARTGGHRAATRPSGRR